MGQPGRTRTNTWHAFGRHALARPPPPPLPWAEGGGVGGELQLAQSLIKLGCVSLVGLVTL